MSHGIWFSSSGGGVLVRDGQAVAFFSRIDADQLERQRTAEAVGRLRNLRQRAEEDGGRG